MTLSNHVPDTQLLSGDQYADFTGQRFTADVNEWLPW